MLIRCSYNNWDTVFGKCKLKNMITLVKTEYIWKMGVATKTIPIGMFIWGWFATSCFTVNFTWNEPIVYKLVEEDLKTATEAIKSLRIGELLPAGFWN